MKEKYGVCAMCGKPLSKDDGTLCFRCDEIRWECEQDMVQEAQDWASIRVV